MKLHMGTKRPKLPQPGELVEARYRIIELLGIGGFGTVYRALQENTGREVALKFLTPDVTKYPINIERFRREAYHVSQLRHPHTITLYDYGQTEAGLVYMVMEFLDGVALSDQIKNDGALQAPRAAHVFIQVLKSLSEVHRSGLVHRDLKPENIFLCEMFGEQDYVKVIDFGIARLTMMEREEVLGEQLGNAEDEEALEEQLTMAGPIVGTPMYMAPEQACAEPITPATDVYALGLLIFEMLTGLPPVTGRNRMDVIHKHILDPVPELTQELEGTPLGDFIRRACKKDPQERYEDAAEMLEAHASALRAMNLQPRAKRATNLPPPLPGDEVGPERDISIGSPFTKGHRKLSAVDEDEGPDRPLDDDGERQSVAMSLLGASENSHMNTVRMTITKDVKRDLESAFDHFDRFLVVYDQSKSKCFPLQEKELPVRIGRARNCEIAFINDDGISRYHAQFELRASNMVLVDLDSRNGTIVDGEQINEAILRDGSTIQVGAQSIGYRDTVDATGRGAELPFSDLLLKLGRAMRYMDETLRSRDYARPFKKQLVLADIPTSHCRDRVAFGSFVSYLYRVFFEGASDGREEERSYRFPEPIDDFYSGSRKNPNVVGEISDLRNFFHHEKDKNKYFVRYREIAAKYLDRDDVPESAADFQMLAENLLKRLVAHLRETKRRLSKHRHGDD